MGGRLSKARERFTVDHDSRGVKTPMARQARRGEFPRKRVPLWKNLWISCAPRQRGPPMGGVVLWIQTNISN